MKSYVRWPAIVLCYGLALFMTIFLCAIWTFLLANPHGGGLLPDSIQWLLFVFNWIVVIILPLYITYVVAKKTAKGMRCYSQISMHAITGWMDMGGNSSILSTIG